MGTAACVVVIPMLGRGHLAQGLADSLARSLADHQARLMFVLNDDDTATYAACAATGADLTLIPGPRQPGDYARKINVAAALTSEEWIFTGASDLVFHPGWLDAAILRSADRYSVVGTNDLGNPLVIRGRMSTHTLVRRAYLDNAVIDSPGDLYSEAYDHNYCDMELIDFAKTKGQFIFAQDSHVEHMHPNWKKAEMDPTYDRSFDCFKDDQRLYIKRQRLWWSRGNNNRLRMEQRRRLRSDR